MNDGCRAGRHPAIRREGRAIASSSGVVIGRVKVQMHGRQLVPEHTVNSHLIEQEVARLVAAIEMAAEAVDIERHHLINAGVRDPLMILDMHHMLITDPELLLKTSSRIRHDCINAEWALRLEMDAIQTVFEQIDDEYLRNRKHDIEHACSRILDHLTGAPERPAGIGCLDEYGDEAVIYVSDDVSVSEVVSMWRHKVAGIITELGGADAHNIIVARGIGLPALVGASGILNDIHDGDSLVLDAEQNVWILNPPQNEQAAYTKFKAAISISQKDLEAFAVKPSLSADGHELKLMANIEFPEELELAEQIGIDGIGLYRSEFLFINESSMPDEACQYEQYVKLIHRMDGKPVTMRLLDVGARTAPVAAQP